MRKTQFLDLLEAVETGEQISKADWDFDRILQPVRSLTAQFDLAWPKGKALNTDLSLADRVFSAAVDLLAGSGVYALETGRVVPLSRDQIEAGCQSAPHHLQMGQGQDAVTLFPRALEDDRPPVVCAGNPGAPTPEALFLPLVMTWAREPLVDMLTCGSLSGIDECPEVPSEISEILTTRRELALLHEALARVDRPGLGMLAAQSSMTALGDLAVSRSCALRPCDAHLVPLQNELKVDRSSLIRAANSLDYGMRNASLATVMVGGLGGGPAGAAVVQTASLMAANLICLADYHLLHPIHIRHVATTTPEVLWVQSVVCQAFARNAPCILFADVYPKSGAGTPELLYETAANALAATVCGAHLEGVGSADGALPNCSSLEARLMAEVGWTTAAKGISLKDAADLLPDLMEKYLPVFERTGGNPGLSFDAVVDQDSLNPTDTWQRIYALVTKDLHRWGVWDLVRGRMR
jgi:methylamine--corrinoid protein Co-methyltransferase